MNNSTQAIILAAGASKRFKRKQSKLVSHICGWPMVVFPLKVLQELNIPITLVLGHQAEEIKEVVAQFGIKNVDYIMQGEPLGTGHAVLCSQEKWNKENILILNADMPLLTVDIVRELLQKHEASSADLSFLSTFMLNPVGYGRVIEVEGKIKIVEEKDCSDDLLETQKVNAGTYVMKRSLLEQYLPKLQKSSVTGEFYLTDMIGIASDNNLRVQDIPAPYDCVRGVNTLQELWAVEQVKRSEVIRRLMQKGVRFELAQSIHIDIDVEIGEDSFVGTGAHILGKTKIGTGCFISAFTIIENTTIGDDTVIHSHSVVQDSAIGTGVHVGPFARLRDGVSVANDVTVGNFVEIKRSTIGENSKTKHLTYVGDATVGKNVNIGAGTIFCNYDGQKKHKTEIEDGVFIGSNNTLVAPLKIGKGAYLAAGSTINKDVGAEDLAIGRARQENKDGYAQKLRKNAEEKEVVVAAEKDEAKKKGDMKFHFIGAIKTRGSSEESL